MIEFNLQEESQLLADPSTYNFDNETDFGALGAGEASALLEGAETLFSKRCLDRTLGPTLPILLRSNTDHKADVAISHPFRCHRIPCHSFIKHRAGPTSVQYSSISSKTCSQFRLFTF